MLLRLMAVLSHHAPDNKNISKVKRNSEQKAHIEACSLEIKEKSDKLMNYFLAGFFLLGLVFATFYDTWSVAFSIGGLSLLSYYSIKCFLPNSNKYQYVISAVFAVFMAQYIYQMHGLFEMHFVAFIGSAILITYQNWKLQIPIAVVVVVHHAVFGYLQFIGYEQVYFTQLDYMDLQTFIIHALFASIIFTICGLWAYQIKKNSHLHNEQSFEIGRLQIAEKQKEELKKANQELDKFVYSVSHDLRAPLKSISGVVSMTAEETTDDFTRENMEIIRESISKLDSFITDMLDYSRNSRADVKREEVDFKKMLNDITNNLKYMGDNNRMVELNVDVKSDTRFCSDTGRIKIVLNNLISNAIRYQNPATNNPYVNISVNTSDKDAKITVKDNGIGIKKEQHEKIFEMFYRVTENSVGSGLGLYLVKETVNKLNGDIMVSSELGEGTEFTLCIPNLYQ